MIKVVFWLAFVLWLPLFIAAVVGMFVSELSLGYRITYLVLTLAIWIPPIGAWLHANRY